MYDLLLILTALLFYFLGRYAGRETEILSTTQKAFKKHFHSSPGGIISYPSPQQQKYYGSEQEKIDALAEKMVKKVGLT